ncbi:hypothetical protein GCM10012275_26060 [Longimycelium tulufanense]|uniref:Uncharacterized protein n=1 Tax=Longimycelium tulufanense TaxID=907463 RepID=A0A8J3FVS8_9PSEU|nr:hypothetical protein [Longimycelium tulufanense]GGM53768.1 hypothetical protein GCM10012275_26060 [Longimycelium tulufanense]
MAEPRRPPIGWLITPLVGVISTALGVTVLFLGQARLVPWLAGGVENVCGTVDCGLGVGVLLLFFGFLVVSCAMVAGTVVGLRRRDDTDNRRAVRRGLAVAGWSLLAYAVLSVVAWWPQA